MSFWTNEFGVTLSVDCPSLRESWAARIAHECLLEAGDNVEAGLAAAQYILSTQSPPVNTIPHIDVFLSHDIHNPAAQGILNRTLKAAKGLSAAARKNLAVALKRTNSGEAILDFVNKYRLQLARLLSTTQLAALLEGAQEVAEKVPLLGAVPVEGLPIAEQERIASLPTPETTPTFALPQPLAGTLEEVHFPTIDNAVKNLAERNVVDRDTFERDGRGGTGQGVHGSQHTG